MSRRTLAAVALAVLLVPGVVWAKVPRAELRDPPSLVELLKHGLFAPLQRAAEEPDDSGEHHQEQTTKKRPQFQTRFFAE